MLQDIEKITKKVFIKFIKDNEEMQAPRAIYNTYINLGKVISDINLVANHYLALDFSEDYLQGSSHGTPADKWRRFFNEDLERLNISTKEYLHALNVLTLKDKHQSLLDELYSAKSFYSFVRSEYNVGFVKPCGFDLVSNVLNTKCDNETMYLSKHNKIDLMAYNQRVELKSLLNARKEKLKIQRNDLKDYILKNYNLEDIVNDIS